MSAPAPVRARRTPSHGPHRLLVPALGLALLATACSAGPADQLAAPRESSVTVATSFYALQYAAERVGGEHATVVALTPPGVDPHDVELSPRQVRQIGDADAVVYLSGFQPPVDQAVEARAPELVLDVRETVDLVAPVGDDDHDEHGDTHDDDHGHDHGDLAGLDPHFWLDPLRMVAVAHGISAVLTEAAPEHADTFDAAAQDLEDELRALDAEYREGLATCERDVVVTSHTAFGYLAREHGFTEIGIAGLDPENEPSPARLREVRAVIDEHDVTTLHATGTASTAVVETLADSLGLEAALLDPLEIQADDDADYVDVMRANLDVLRTALGCR